MEQHRNGKVKEDLFLDEPKLVEAIWEMPKEYRQKFLGGLHMAVGWLATAEKDDPIYEIVSHTFAKSIDPNFDIKSSDQNVVRYHELFTKAIKGRTSSEIWNFLIGYVSLKEGPKEEFV